MPVEHGVRTWSDRACSWLATVAPVAVCACSLVASMPLFRVVMPASSDGLFHLYRAWELDRLWSVGTWLPRWAPDFYFGYGYPIFRYTPPLPYALVDVVHGLGLDWTASFRAVLALGLPLSALAAYLLARSIFTPAAAVVCGVAYALAPYHLVNLYQRGDLSEYLAAIWLPLMLWAIVRLGQGILLRGLVALSAATAGLLLTHNLSVMLFLPLAAALWLGVLVLLVATRLRADAMHARAGVRPLHFATTTAVAVALSLGLTAFFWLPAFVERNQAQFFRLFHSYGYGAHFTKVEELVSFDAVQQYPPVFAFAHGSGYQFALWQGLAVLAGLAALPLLWVRLDGRARLLMAGAPLVCLAALFMATESSRQLWAALPTAGLIQFPWRFLALAALPAALLAAAAVEVLPHGLRWPAAALVVALVVVGSTGALRPIDLRVPRDEFSPAGYARFESRERLAGTTAAAEYLPPSAPERAETSPSAFALITGQPAPQGPTLPVVAKQAWGLLRLYDVTLPSAARVTLDTLTAPGLNLEVDRRPVTPGVEPRSGLAQIDVPAGRHVVVATMGETSLERAADAVSWIAAGLAAFSAMAWLVTTRPRVRLVAVPVGVVCVALCVAIPLATGARDDAGPGLAGAALQDGVVITSASVGTGTDGIVRVQPPGLVQIVGDFDVPAGLAGGVSPFVRLTASDGLTWAQVVGDALGQGQSGHVKLTLPIPAGTPPGAYRLELGAARAASGNDRPAELPLRGLVATPLLPLTSTAPLATVVIPTTSSFPSTQSLAEFDQTVELGAPAIAAKQGDSADLIAPIASGVVCGGTGDTLCVEAGDVLEVRLPWHEHGVAGHAMTVSLQLLDSSGAQWASADAEPASGRFPPTFWPGGADVLDDVALPIPSYVPPGDYKLVAAVARDGQRVGVSDATGRSLGSEATLAAIRLRPAERDVAFLTVIPPVPEQPHRDAGLGLTLRGAAVGPAKVQVGGQLDVRELWAARSPSRPDVDVSVSLLSGDGARQTLKDAPPAAAYPTSQWRPGVPVLTLWTVRLPTSIEPGAYAVTTTLHSGDERGPELTLGEVTVLPAPPAPAVHFQQAVDAVFGEQMKLLGADPALPAQRSAAAPVDVTLYWQGTRTMDTGYSVSVQLLDATGKLAAQEDQPPGGDGRSTPLWLPGVPVVDRHPLDLSKLASGTYVVQVVVYDSSNGERLHLADGTDAYQLGRLSVIP